MPPLVAGDFLSREEFLRRWESMPGVKRAELVRGVVYMPSPLSMEHGDMEAAVGFWLGMYAIATPGCRHNHNSTCVLADDETPQPNLHLRILPEYGGQSRPSGRFLGGAPEFLSEVCISSTAYDLHQKLEVYQENDVREYLAVLMRERELHWHRLVDGRFEVVPLPEDGIYRSSVFPGLWLDAAALLALDLPRVVNVLNQGIATPEHQAFVAQLQSQRQR